MAIFHHFSAPGGTAIHPIGAEIRDEAKPMIEGLTREKINREATDQSSLNATSFGFVGTKEPPASLPYGPRKRDKLS